MDGCVNGPASVAWRMKIPWARMEIPVLCQRSNLGAQLVTSVARQTTSIWKTGGKFLNISLVIFQEVLLFR